MATTDDPPEGDTGSAVGAAWCGIFDETDAGYGFAAADVPELGIGVAANWRNRGVEPGL